MIAVRMTEIRDALRKSKRYFAGCSKQMRHAWVRGYLECRWLNKAPISAATPALPTMFCRDSRIKHGELK